MNMNVLRGKLLKNNVICINILCLLVAKVSYADYITVYGFDAAENYKHKHPGSTYLVQVASFSKEQSAINYQMELQKTSKFQVNVNPKIVNNKKVYAVVIGPIQPNNKIIVPIANQESNHQANFFTKITKLTNVHNLFTKSNKQSIKTDSMQATHKVEINDSHKSTSQFLNKYLQPIKFPGNQSMNNWWSKSNWYLSIGGGEQFPNDGNTVYVNNGSSFPSPYNTDIYSGSSRTNDGIFTLAGGRTWSTSNHYIPAYSIGVMWQDLFRNKLNGQITQNSDPDFLNYNYELSTASNVILGYSKINILNYKKVLPYFNVGIGGTINRTKNYHEEALENVTARVSPQFKSDSKTQFAYLLGAGFDVLANDNISLSAGYNYLNTGKLATGYGVSTWSTTRLDYGTGSTNEVLITLNYKFNKNRILS